uniref:Transmembrane protein 170A n=1 Tax=Plectus sambesii TaxID=2011161 RepID=A0A914UJ92_9BILA
MPTDDSYIIPLLPGRSKPRTDSTDISGIGDILMLNAGSFNSFYEMWLSIFLWMAVTYIVVHLIAAAVSLLMLRRHAWMLGLSLPIIAMMAIGPATIGAITSAGIAWSFYQSGSEMPN